MSEMNTNNPINVGSPRALSNRTRHSRAQTATSPRSTQNISPSQNHHRSIPNIDDGAAPNAEKLYTDDGHSDFNVDPNAPVLSGGVGEDTMREFEVQREREEEDRRQEEAAKGAAGGGNRFVGGFVLGLKNALRPRWGGAGTGRPAQTTRDPYPAFPLAVHEPEPDDDDDDDGRYDQSQHDRERGRHPGDVEHHAGASRQRGQQPEHGLRHRTSYQSLDSPSETHPTTEWHDDGTTAVDHTGYNYSQYPINYDARGNPIPPLIPPASSSMRPQSNLPNPENVYSSYNYHYPPNYVPSQSNYIPANSNGVYPYTVGSPVLADIKPASDYAKMDIPPSPGPSEISFNTYLNRIRRVVEHVNSLPWVAERVTVDYYPAGIKGAKLERKEREKERIRRQDEEKLGPGGIFGDGIALGRKDRKPILSWYDRNKIGGPHANPGEIDLTAGSPPQPVQAQPSVGQAMTDNIGGTTPYSPLAPATIPPIAVTPSGITVGMTPRPGDAVPLAPGLYPSSDANAASSQPLVPPSSLEPMYTGGSTPGGAGATVRLTSSPPNATFGQPFDHPSSPGYTHRTMPGGAPSSQASGLPGMMPTPGLDTGSVTIDVVPPSTSASASAMSRTPVIPGQSGSISGNMPTAGPTPVTPFVAAPSATVSPPRSTTHSHTRSPSVPVTSSQNPRSPSLRHTRTHTRAPSAAGSVTSRRAPNPNTPVHFFPANVPATSPPPRTPIPSAPPTPAQNQGQSQNPGPSLNAHSVNNLNGYTPLAPGIMAARSEGGHSDRSGKSGLSAMTGKSGRSWVVVNGAATPSSSATDDSRDLGQSQNRRNGSVTGNDHGYSGYGGGYGGAGSVNGYGATPRVTTRGLNNNRRDTFETAQTPVSVNPSTHFETPVVSTYAGEEGQGYGRATGGGYGYGQGGHGGIYDRKGKGKAAPASVQTVSDTGSSPSGRSEDIYDPREYRMFQHYERMQQQHQQQRGKNGNGRTQVQGGLGGEPSFSYGKSQSQSMSPGPAYGYPYSVPRSRQP